MRMILRRVVNLKDIELAEGAQVLIEGQIDIVARDDKVIIRYCYNDEIKRIEYIDKAHKGQEIKLP